MPRTQPAVEDVSRSQPADFAGSVAGRLLPQQFVVSAEHASNDIPARYKNLGLTRRQIEAHIAWDPGSKTIARACAKVLGCPGHEGRYSRLLVDLNRSLHHRKLMARESFSIAIPGNQNISREQRERRIRLYYTPFRDAVLDDVRRVVETRGLCIHLSIHSFTPAVDGVTRTGDIGILYDPARRIEKALATNLIDRIATESFRVRRNFPYRGVNDGHVTRLRTLFGPSKYAGLEVEVNQNLLQTASDIRRIAGTIATAVQSLVS